jgi:hypothetical protein
LFGVAGSLLMTKNRCLYYVFIAPGFISYYVYWTLNRTELGDVCLIYWYLLSFCRGIL